MTSSSREISISKRSEFLTDDCGRNLVQQAARGATIIAELLRLSERIPTAFSDPASSEHAAFICDFSYFRTKDSFEAKIKTSEDLSQRDDAFGATHRDLLICFFKLFRSVYNYVTEVNRLVRSIRDGQFVSQSLSTVLGSPEGLQVLCEIYHLYGTMLLLLDDKIGGKTREHLLVSHFRYQGAGEPLIVEISGLCRATGYLSDESLPDGYPAGYFARVPVDTEVVNQLIGRIRSEDIYERSHHYPLPEHRGVAMARQGALAYILLFFCPEILEKEVPVMREIVDKHFVDNWVVNYYLGFTADLTVTWRGYTAANKVIQHTIALDSVQYYQKRIVRAMRTTSDQMTRMLRDRVLTESYVLSNMTSELLPILREANAVLRWCILHGTRPGGVGGRYDSTYQARYDAVLEDITTGDILSLLLSTARLECQLRTVLSALFRKKRKKWRSAKREATRQLTRLAAYFSGEGPLAADNANEQLAEWFRNVASRTESLHEPADSRRRLLKLVKALESVLEFSQVNRSLHVVKCTRDATQGLKIMLRYVDIDDRVFSAMDTVGDFSYAWECMSTYDYFVAEIQQNIKSKPALSVQMRAVFVKLATLINIPCLRVHQACEADRRYAVALDSTTDYYSTSLVAFIRRVLHVLPTSIFEALRKVMHLLTDAFEECPSKVNRWDMLAISQLPIRERLSTYTADIARYASGVLAMDTAVMGVIHVHPHQLLEDGIRRELVDQVARELHAGIRFDRKRPLSAAGLVEELQRVGQRLQGIRKSFEYIQDYIAVHGLRIWQEEMSRIVGFTVDMEGNSFVQKQMYPWNSPYQSDRTPIPFFDRDTERSAYSFLGHLVQHLLYLTDPMQATYLRATGAWHKRSSLEESVGLLTFNHCAAALGSVGLAGLDQLIGIIIAKDLQMVLRLVHKSTEAAAALLAEIVEKHTPSSLTPPSGLEDYQRLMSDVGDAHFSEVTEVLVRVGRLQLMRHMIGLQLREAGKLDSGCLFVALTTVNNTLLTDLHMSIAQPDRWAPPPPELVVALTPMLERTGLTDPASQVYITPKPIVGLVPLIVGLTLRNVSHIRYEDTLAACMPARPQDLIDPTAYAAGLGLFMRQFSTQCGTSLFHHLAQALRMVMHAFRLEDLAVQQREVLPTRAEVLCLVTEMLRDAMQWPTSEIAAREPPALLGGYRSLVAKPAAAA